MLLERLTGRGKVNGNAQVAGLSVVVCTSATGFYSRLTTTRHFVDCCRRLTVRVEARQQRQRHLRTRRLLALVVNTAHCNNTTKCSSSLLSTIYQFWFLQNRFPVLDSEFKLPWADRKASNVYQERANFNLKLFFK